ncbi:TrkH family potassium uptake protein [Haliovirga abyssi]|uniref:Potassium transporter KtrB n=1 Tax=Haliovirga abyssi TaxID=2996794 RepID=A0AAU9DDQ3_9FUSO|nr:TrkH family potassium uptake protein [Haliovirga abyssi]BDU50303.1 potassium transporter KtrB [Haliovirga abyssi]
MGSFFKLKKKTPSQILINSFLVIIFIGTTLLSLPISKTNNGSFDIVTAIFTATSAVSVTGLSIVDVSTYYNDFGKVIILILIQLGGLGIMTFSSIIMLIIGRRITYEEKKILQEDLNQEKLGGIIHFIKKLFFTVATIELIGAIFLFIEFSKQFGFTNRALFYSIFHSVSAFCNAGFSLFGDSLVQYKSNYIINIVISSLIVLGGIGFSVINGFIGYTKTGKKKFSLTSRMAIKISIWMIVIGTILIFFTEGSNVKTIGDLNFFDKLLASLFQSITTRTAGFNTVSIGDLKPATIFLFIVWMFIGASPGSTGGGIKTTTFGVIIYSVFSIIRNKKDVEIKNRRISWHILNRALAILVISLFYVILITLSILIVEEKDFIQIFFEVISAFGTVGLSMGVTADLTTFSKVLLIITMLVGRVGPLTFALALGENLEKPKYRYPRENISVG